MESPIPFEVLGNDEAVIGTNDDASSCKKYAVSQGYWCDPYIKFFVRSADRRAPEISRGYYGRIRAIEILIENFIDITGGKCQVVNIGAGFDTLYWRLRDSNRDVCSFIELDFPDVTARKCRYIQHSKQLLQKISHEDYDIKLNQNNLHSHKYKIMGVDIRNLSDVQEKLKECEVDFKIPTVFLAECVLVYMSIEKSSELLQWIASAFKSALFINYEMVNLKDRFGEVMLNNLRIRGCDLLGAQACLDLKSQQNRFTKCGWGGAEAIDMMGVWSRLPPEDVSRVMKIELLDEQELLLQLFSHYCITMAWTDSRWSEVQL